MSSSIFFKFKSQKEPTRLPFDGTAISVFDAKRDIIAIHKLGDGTDFDLAIYNEENNEEYVDDTVMIPRGTAIIARRLPPAKPGRGTAQRYVTGKMPTAALSAGRVEKKVHTIHAGGPTKPTATSAPSAVPGLGAEGQTEEERIAAMFQASSEQWNQTQEQMANARPIHGQGGFKKKNVPAPSHPPPTGYVCYRCGEKGHWIQQCPTNADPNFDGRPRVKRTTGIPKSFLKTVEKPVITDEDDGKPVSVMVNADGEYVVAEPDRASWEQYQQKTKAAGLTGEAAAEAKILEEKGLACPIDNKLFKDAVKTPCCKKTYCDDCIQNALVESDLVCPNCDTKEVLLDRLIPDTETRERVKEYLDSKRAASEEKEKEKSKSPTPAKAAIVKTEPGVKKESGTPKLEAAKPVDAVLAPSNPKKRSAEDDGTSMKRSASAASNDSGSKRLKPSPTQQIAIIPNTGNSPAMQNVALATNGIVQTQNQNQQHSMGFSQNGFMGGGGGGGGGNMNGFDFNNNNMGNMMNNNNNNNNVMGFNNNNMGNMSGMNMNNMGMNMGMGMSMNSGMMNNNMSSGYNNMNMTMMGNNMGNNMGNSMSNNMGNNMVNNMGGNMGGNMVNNMGMNGGGGYNNNMMSGYNNMNSGGGGGYGMNNMTNNGYYNNAGGGYNNNQQQFNNNQQWGMQQQHQQPQQRNMNMVMGQNSMNMGNGMMAQQNQGWNNNVGMGSVGSMSAAAYQARKVFSEPFPTDEDSPYMRKPVNPYRHMRPKRARPSDYTAVGGGVTD
ncbi:E3 ubiquitin-protein ligase rbbp6 [Arthrobotrys conoides]|uniref:E3 ubiquitin-protein ligase rbbp6 n=1 Tax=Arthrobotrys conoides TaxID=74498 RepID=A0AAN8NLS7_9PEZI